MNQKLKFSWEGLIFSISMDFGRFLRPSWPPCWGPSWPKIDAKKALKKRCQEGGVLKASWGVLKRLGAVLAPFGPLKKTWLCNGTGSALIYGRGFTLRLFAVSCCSGFLWDGSTVFVLSPFVCRVSSCKRVVPWPCRVVPRPMRVVPWPMANCSRRTHEYVGIRMNT